jgi:hypothetical protein
MLNQVVDAEQMGLEGLSGASASSTSEVRIATMMGFC